MRSFALAFCIVAAASASPVKFDISAIYTTNVEKVEAASLQLGKLRRYTSAAASGMTSGDTPSPPPGGKPTPPPGPATPTVAPTAIPAGHTQITQIATIPLTAAEFAQEHYRVVYERAYGHTLGIFDSSTNRYVTGASVTATTVSRRAINVQYAASVPPTYAANAQTQSTALRTNPGLLAAGVTAAKTAAAADPNDPLSSAIASVPTPLATDISVQAPTVTIVSSGASSMAASVCTAVALAVVALRH